MENSRSKQFLNFILYSILNSVMKSHTAHPGHESFLYPAHPQCISYLSNSHLRYLSYQIHYHDIKVLYVQATLFYIIQKLFCFIIRCCYSSLTVPNLEIKFYHRYVFVGKNIVYIGFVIIHDFRNPLGSWNISPKDKGGHYI